MTFSILGLVLFSLSVSWSNAFTAPATRFRQMPASIAFQDPSNPTYLAHQPLASQQSQQNQEPERKMLIPSWISSTIVATSMMVGVSFMNLPWLPTPPASAETSKVVGKLQGSGLVFKDTLLIERFEGKDFICCYCSYCCCCCCSDHVVDIIQWLPHNVLINALLVVGFWLS